MDGFILVDKPKGITSGECARMAANTLNAGKAGHAGSLDGNASGMLLVALGAARKSIGSFMRLRKEYRGTLRLHGDADREAITAAFRKSTGRIVQTPPRKSRVARKPREREVYSLEIIRMRGRDVEFAVSCEAGTYIRKLASDIGAEIGCGGHLAELRRTRIGPFTEKDSVSLENLSGKYLISAKEAINRLK
ncbi:MAG: hypothetical protein HY518_04730 [Candidatus Aenigmarchaeota archaeon]|nr:hypothetical protein [Candidatus Aenigmarchaeota archaeon]